jgi:cardiolipin synthase C
MDFNKAFRRVIIVCSLGLVAACVQLPTDFEKNPSYRLISTGKTHLGDKSSELREGNTTNSKVLLLNDGVDAFVARASLIELAQKTIDVQYYIWHSDLIGKLLLNSMLNAADKGVRVRILLDDMPIDNATETFLYGLDQHKHIEVRLYNPFASRGFRLIDFLSNPARINRRMHNKSFSVDSQFTVIGGRNIGEEYFSASEKSNFTDLDVIAIGPIVNDIEEQFDIYWNSDVVYPVKAFDHNSATESDLEGIRQELDDFVSSQKNSKYYLDIQDSEMYKNILEAGQSGRKKALTYSGLVEVIYDDPAKGLGATQEDVIYLKHSLEPYIEGIVASVEIISPYFVPGLNGVEYLTGLVEKGIDVRVLTNSLSSTDGLMAQSGYSRRRYQLLRGGIELYEFKTDVKSEASKSLRRGEKAKSGLHAKVYIFDREQVFIGSFNLDQRSANINSEVGVIYDMNDMAKFIGTNVFDNQINQIAYKVSIAQEEIVSNGITIEKGDVYWVDLAGNVPIYHDTEPETTFWRRFGQGFYSTLPIESQL